MGIKIISITLAGKSGQPAMANALNVEICSLLPSRVLKISKNSFIKRVVFSITLGFRLLRGKNKYIVHLGLEAMFARCLFPLRGRAVFINHGIYNFPIKTSLLRNLSILIEKLGNLINDIYYVNREQMEACGSRLNFTNRININGLNFRKRYINGEVKIGFIGCLFGQKNCAVLKEAVQNFNNISFIHMGQKTATAFFNSTNYSFISQDMRGDFFESIDVLLIPSIYESYCLVAYEAIYSGIYLIHSGVDGLSTFPYTSTIVKSNEPNEWIHAIETVLGLNIQTENIYIDNQLAMNKNARNILNHLIGSSGLKLNPD